MNPGLGEPHDGTPHDCGEPQGWPQRCDLLGIIEQPLLPGRGGGAMWDRAVESWKHVISLDTFVAVAWMLVLWFASQAVHQRERKPPEVEAFDAGQPYWAVSPLLNNDYKSSSEQIVPAPVLFVICSVVPVGVFLVLSFFDTCTRATALRIQGIAYAFGGAACTMFAPDAGIMAEWRRPAGERFPADGYWSGNNKGRGARVRCHFNGDSLEALGKDGLLLHVLDAAGDTVRTMDAEPEEGGMDMMYWDMRGTGAFWPSRRKRDKDARPGGGFPVDPGTYRMVLEVKGDSASRIWEEIDIEVMADPRRAPSTDILVTQRAHMDQIYAVSGRADAVYESLKRMRRAEDAVAERMRHAKRSMDKGDTTYKVVKELTDSLEAEWTELDERYFTPEDFNGYDAVVRISDRLWHAMSYADGGLAAPGSNADDALKALDRAVTAAEGHLDRIREVFAAWRTEVEAVDWPLFGEFEE